MKELTCKEVREFMKEHFTTYPTIRADSLKKEIDSILAAFSASYSNNRYKCAFITDKAQVSDFPISEEQILKASEILSVEINRDDLITDVAERLSQ